MEDNNHKNMILAMVLSLGVVLIWFWLFPPPEPTPEAEQPVAVATENSAAAPAASGAVSEPVPEAPRLTIDTPELEGSISLLGGRIDDLRLKNYRETIEDGAPIVRMLSPQGEANAWFALFGWRPGGSLTAEDVPGAQTEWSLASGGTLRPDQPVTLQ